MHKATRAEQDIGEKGGKHSMKNRIKYTDGPIGKIQIIKDFLPSPDDLILRERQVKVTINLKEDSIAFFKKIAKENHTPYQKVIRNLLDKYASHFA